MAAGVIALGAGELLRQPPSSAADGTALVLGPAGSVRAAQQATPAFPAASPRPSATQQGAPAISVVGDAAGASSLVRTLLAAGLHAGVSVRSAAGRLGPVSVPTVLYRPAAAAAASKVAAVLSTRLPGTTVAPMSGTTDTSSSVVVLLPAAS